ncbi:hypothetical protein GCM10023225_31120 [Kineococcus glutinatus]|uniref:DUF4383 domain-containing protein n=2 Tax=Kineococcus glutinatus TaxID=1070872 RepID=A0ABP9IA62_9ACTN
MARAVGVVFLLVGVLGFVPGITADHDELHVMGPESQAMLLGLLQVSVLHNALHLLYGVAAFACSATPSAAHKYLVLGGLGYLVLALIGTASMAAGLDNPIPVNGWDDLLHYGLAVGMVGLGYVGYRRHRARWGTF